MWKNDKELFALMKEQLYTAVVGDILDACGHYHQFLPARIRPMNKKTMKIAGRAMPVLMADVFGPQEKPYGLMTEALDQLEPGEVYIASGGNIRSSYWGEILTTTARMRGAAGAVVNGWHRDTHQVLAQNFPVFSRGAWARDSSVRSHVADFRCPIEIEAVLIEPGDLIFGDVDGVVVIPKRLEQGIIENALEKAQAEKTVRSAIEHGMSSTEAFAKYGVL